MLRLAACLLILSTTRLYAQHERDTTTTIDSTSTIAPWDESDLDSEGYDAPETISRGDISFLMTAGLSGGGGFGETLTPSVIEAEYRTHGAPLFLDIGLGLELRVKNQFFFTPRINWLFSTINRRYTQGWDRDNVSIYSMLTCGAGGRYYFYESLPYSFYIQGDVGMLITSSKISNVPYTSDKLATGALIGYSYNWHGRGIGFELGYRSIPVSHTWNTVQFVDGRAVAVEAGQKKNFGGMFFSIVWRFQLFDGSGNVK